MKSLKLLNKLALMLMLPLLLIVSCGNPSPVTVRVTPPPLPAQAKASQVETPSECLPTCSAGWAKLVSESADMLMK